MRNFDLHIKELDALWKELADARTLANTHKFDPIMFSVGVGYLNGDVFEMDDAGNILNIPPDAERLAAVAEARAWVASGQSLLDWFAPGVSAAQGLAAAA